MKPDVAFLVYLPLKQRREDNSFDGNGNVGAKVIADVLTRGGVDVGFCSAATAHEYRLVLVSLTSTYDVFAFYQAVALRPDWQPGKRQFRVLVGGFGMQNPTAIRNYVDFAVFGRAEDFVVDLVREILNGEPVPRASVMRLPEISPVSIAQASRLYPFEVEGFKESFTGCPLKCKFCHFTYARKQKGEDESYPGVSSYVQTQLSNSMPELTWDGIVLFKTKLGRARAAIDGFSERLRYILGKRISCDDIVQGIERVGRFGPNPVTLIIYNIANFPTETQDDREELYVTLSRCRPKFPVIFVLHSTPFRPSIATPMQWEPVSLTPDNSKLREKVIVLNDTFRAVHSFTIETPWSHLTSVIAERATPDTDKLFHALAFAPKLKSARAADKTRAVLAGFDCSPYLREYDPDEQHPAWFIESYVPNASLRVIARKMRRDLAGSIGWVPGQGGPSMVQARINEAISEGVATRADIDAVV